MIKVLVTGAAGFIGSHVCDHLVNSGYDVIALDDLSGGFEDNVNSKAKFIKGSINDVDLINQLFEEHQFTYVYHLAAYAAEGLSHFIRRFNYNNNLIGSINLINASINAGTVKCFVFTSSIAVYGERQNIGDPYRNVVGIFMNQIMQGKKLTVFGDGMQTRAFSHIDDVAPIIAKSVEMREAYNEVFNIGADTPYTVKELTTLVCDAFGVSEQIEYLEARNEVVHAYSNHDKVHHFFGHMIKNISLKDGIERMVADAKEKGPRTGEKFKNIEVEKNMPPAWLKLM